MEKSNEANVDRWIDDRMATLAPDSEWTPNVASGLVRFRKERNVVGPRRRRWAWIAAGATTVILFSTPMARSFAELCGGFLVRSLGGHVPTRAYTSPDRRDSIPDFTLNDALGHPVRLSDFRGQVVLLNFWATSCGQCQDEIPWFVEFQHTYRNRGLVVLGVSLDEDGWTSVKPYVDEKKISYRVMVGNDDIARSYSGSLPTTLIIDKSGRIAVTHTGFCSKSEYEADTQTVLAEQ